MKEVSIHPDTFIGIKSEEISNEALHPQRYSLVSQTQKISLTRKPPTIAKLSFQEQKGKASRPVPQGLDTSAIPFFNVLCNENDLLEVATYLH